MAPPQPTAAQNAQNMRNANMQARALLIQNCVDSVQNIYSSAVTTGAGTVLNIPLRNVGLIKRLYVEVNAQVQTAAGTTQTLTKLGASNFFSLVVLTDLSNQSRISTSGWHLTAIATAKARLPYGSAITAIDSPFGYGNNMQKTQAAPATITVPSTGNNLYAMFEIPLAYSDSDLRGSIYANVVNATMNLQLTVNPTMFVASGADATLAVYQSSGATLATLPSFVVTVYQNYLDQIPIGKNGPILPLLDLSTAYLINNTALSGIVANQDYPIQYANFRDFLSTTVVYDNAGVLNPGTDINYFALQSANYTNVFKYDPNIASLFARLRIQDDFPTGMYYFDHRNKPISTVQYGNMQLLINPLTVTNSSATFLVGWEALALINQVTQAGSLYGN